MFTQGQMEFFGIFAFQGHPARLTEMEVITA